VARADFFIFCGNVCAFEYRMAFFNSLIHVLMQAGRAPWRWWRLGPANNPTPRAHGQRIELHARGYFSLPCNSSLLSPAFIPTRLYLLSSRWRTELVPVQVGRPTTLHPPQVTMAAVGGSGDSGGGGSGGGGGGGGGGWGGAGKRAAPPRLLSPRGGGRGGGAGARTAAGAARLRSP